VKTELALYVISIAQKRSHWLTQSLDDLEKEVEQNPNDAKKLVALANAYWLTGRGSEPVGELASRAIAADPDNRAGWHLWALSESDPRQRLGRWQQVSERFPSDDLARANVADNAAALAGAEHDHEALDLAIATYEILLSTATEREQKDALDAALRSLRGWKL
jgi:tetratricopeptide (TPR) repeat protein